MTLKSHWQGDIVPFDFTVNSVPCSHRTLVQNSPYNIENPTFDLKKSVMCPSVICCFCREVTRSLILFLSHNQRSDPGESAHSLSLLVPVCSRAISVSEWWQDACFFPPCNKAVQADRSLLWSILSTLHGAVLSEYVGEGWFVWLVFIMVICKIIKGKSWRLCCFCYNSSEMLKVHCSVSKKVESLETLVIVTFLMSPALYVRNVLEDQFCLKLVWVHPRPLCLVSRALDSSPLACNS